jgi:subtilisin-like proprotein convertase family protein
VFGTVRDLDEAADGTWTLQVIDGAAGDTGTFQSWSLKFRGH